MATMPMSITDQEMSPAEDLGDRTPREDTEEIQAQGMDNTPQADNEEMQPQETHNALLDVVLNDCRVEMVPLDAIYVEGDQQDDDLVKALAHSIGLIGLQNPICIVENDIEGHPAPYRLVSGRKRYAAFLKLKCPTIPAHILSYAETDSEKEIRKALATTEENLVRKHYSLIELCELVGKSKEIYEQIHPETTHGKASKKKDSGTESFRPVSYLTVAAQQLGKSRATVWKYITIYQSLIEKYPQDFEKLKQVNHPILNELENLLKLSKCGSYTYPSVIIHIMCGYGNDISTKRTGKPCGMEEALSRYATELDKIEAKSNAHEQSNNNKSSKSENSTQKSPETPLPASTLAVPPSASAVEMSTSQPHDATATPPLDEALISTQHSETPAWDTSSEAELTTVEDVLIGLEEHVNVYLRDKNIFKRFKVVSHKLPNELRITVQ